MSFLTNIASTAAILDFFGLESKTSASRRAASCAAYFAGGAIIGAVAALALAPKSGRELRTDLAHKTKNLQSRMGNASTTTLQAAKKKLGVLKSQTPDVSSIGAAEGVPSI